MSEHAFSPAEMDRSVEYLTRPDSYAPFDLDGSQRLIIGCIDPRDQHGKALTVLQTGGGAAGEGMDSAIAHSIMEKRPVSLEEGLTLDVETRTDVKLAAHGICKFIAGMDSVKEEVANPTAFTEDTYDRYLLRYDLWDTITPPVTEAVQDATKELWEEPPQEAELLPRIDSLYPASVNVANMKGENRARIYVVNHHPNVGLDRHKKHRIHKPPVQAYHESLGATVANLKAMHSDPELLKYRLAAHLLRAAAVRTVIGTANEDTRYLEAEIGEGGIKVEETKIAA